MGTEADDEDNDEQEDDESAFVFLVLDPTKTTAGVRPTTDHHLVWPIEFEHSEQQARLAPRRGERAKHAERGLEAGELCNR